MFQRSLQQNIESRIQRMSEEKSRKAIVLLGPRQVGKTTLLRTILENKKKVLFLDADDPTVRKMLTNPNTEELKNVLLNTSYVFIDEGQRVENIGITLKIIIDQIKNVQVLLSGSSSFELANKTHEPLTGRKWQYLLLPLSWHEFESHVGYLKAQQQLPLRLVYGMYPEVVSNPDLQDDLLKQLCESYLYKDILAYGGIRKPDVLEKLLRALAFQVGNEVSYNEVSQLLGIDVKTVSSYIDLLVQAYVVFKLPSLSRNLRNEIKTNQKIYFYDNGIRNFLIGNLNPIQNRQDIGVLWENFLMGERIKKNAYSHLTTQSLARSYFWRTKQQQEIDYVEEVAEKFFAFEFKWSPEAKVKSPQNFTLAYHTQVMSVNRENFREFVL